MAIEVALPDGSIAEFPDGTPPETMKAAIARKLQSAPAAPAQTPEAPAMPAPRPSLFRMDSDFQDRSGVGAGGMLTAAAKDTFGSRQGAAEYLANAASKTGGTVIQGPNGDPMVQLGDGTVYALNDPGLDNADVAGVTSNVAALFTPFAYLNSALKAKNVGLGGRVVVQGLAGTTADAGIQAVADNGRIDPVRTLLAGGGGAAGEVIAPVLKGTWARLSSIVRSGTSQPQTARSVLAEIGITTPTPQQLKEAQQAVSEIAAGADPGAVLGKTEWGFRYTLGQRTADPVLRQNQMGVEEVLREQPGSNAPFIRADEQNAKALTGAVEGITERLGGQRGATPGELMDGVQGRVAQQADALKGRIREAYDVAGQSNRAAVTTASAKALPQRLTSSVADFDLEVTPIAKRTIEQISGKVGNLPPNVSGVTLRAVEAQRKIINNNIAAAASNPADRAAMTALKREYDSWVDDAVDDALLSGDPAALSAIKEARSLRAEFGKRFEGNAQADKFVRDLVAGQRTPEEMLNVAMGAGQVSKDSGGRFIQRLRLAVNDDPQTLGALRAAQFLRMVQNKGGEQLGPQAIVNNIARMELGNRSMVDALYSPEQWREVKRLAGALEPFVPSPMQAKSSGSIERLIRYLSGAASRLPFVGGMVDGIGSVKNAIDAEQVFTAPVRAPVRSSPGVTAAGAGVAGQYGASTAQYQGY